MSAELAAERRVVLRALAVVALAAAALVVADLVRIWAEDETSRADLVRACLAGERGAPTLEPPAGSFAAASGLPAVRTELETNWVTYLLPATEDEAEEVQARALLESPATVERRGLVLYLWEQPPSPTQQQAAYDCSY